MTPFEQEADLAEARRLLRARDLAASEQAYKRVLDAAPDNLEALTAVALGSLRAGNPSWAVTLLERACAVSPGDPLTQHHLGSAYHAIGDVKRAARAHGNAVKLDSSFFLARLAWARCLQQQGHKIEAIIQYKRSLDDAQSRGRWLDPSSTPELLRPLVEDAVRAVREERRTTFAALLSSLQAKFGRDSMERVERWLRIYLGDEAAVHPDPRQQPSFLFFPGLPASPYIDLACFDWIDSLETRSAAIRAEMTEILGAAGVSEPVFASQALEAQNLRGSQAPPSWTGYYFFRHGVRRTDNCERCPLTTRALEALPLPVIREHGPEVLFSIFTPGTHLMPHRGVTNTRVVGHLPLVVPKNCALSVGNEKHDWQEGKVVVFDDTYEHEAWNRSDELRVVLIFDIWNPYMSEAERMAVTRLVGEIGDFRNAVEHA